MRLLTFVEVKVGLSRHGRHVHIGKKTGGRGHRLSGWTAVPYLVAIEYEDLGIHLIPYRM
jgi:hypothetical protein